MERKFNALVLKSADYRENDKILTLLTPENGRITAVIKGVKKAGAKLKFAAQPFCFAEYVLAERGGRYTVTGASECESFYDLRTDVNRLYAASAATEAASALSFEGDECAEMFSELVKTLSAICVGSEAVALIKFLVFALRKSGYGLASENCIECGKQLFDERKLRFDMDAGAFTCWDCGNGAGVSRVTYNVLRKTDGKSYREEFITADGEKRALKLLKEYYSYKLGETFKSLSEYKRLL